MTNITHLCMCFVISRVGAAPLPKVARRLGSSVYSKLTNLNNREQKDAKTSFFASAAPQVSINPDLVLEVGSEQVDKHISATANQDSDFLLIMAKQIIDDTIQYSSTRNHILHNVKVALGIVFYSISWALSSKMREKRGGSTSGLYRKKNIKRNILLIATKLLKFNLKKLSTNPVLEYDSLKGDDIQINLIDQKSESGQLIEVDAKRILYTTEVEIYMVKPVNDQGPIRLVSVPRCSAFMRNNQVREGSLLYDSKHIDVDNFIGLLVNMVVVLKDMDKVKVNSYNKSLCRRIAVNLSNNTNNNSNSIYKPKCRKYYDEQTGIFIASAPIVARDPSNGERKNGACGVTFPQLPVETTRAQVGTFLKKIENNPFNMVNVGCLADYFMECYRKIYLLGLEKVIAVPFINGHNKSKCAFIEGVDSLKDSVERENKFGFALMVTYLSHIVGLKSLDNKSQNAGDGRFDLLLDGISDQRKGVILGNPSEYAGYFLHLFCARTQVEIQNPVKYWKKVYDLTNATVLNIYTDFTQNLKECGFDDLGIARLQSIAGLLKTYLLTSREPIKNMLQNTDNFKGSDKAKLKFFKQQLLHILINTKLLNIELLKPFQDKAGLFNFAINWFFACNPQQIMQFYKGIYGPGSQFAIYEKSINEASQILKSNYKTNGGNTDAAVQAAQQQLDMGLTNLVQSVKDMLTRSVVEISITS